MGPEAYGHRQSGSQQRKEEFVIVIMLHKGIRHRIQSKKKKKLRQKIGSQVNFTQIE